MAYLTYCKQRIEGSVGWHPSAEWRHRDYRNLAELIEEKTGVHLSVSTLRRIWSVDFSGTPQVATLNALAQYLGHADWLQFKKDINGSVPADNGAGEQQRVSGNKKKYGKLALVALAVLIFGYFLLGRVNGEGKPEQGRLAFVPDSVSFSSKNALSSGVPNTVVFNYDVSGVTADSFFIQQSWDPRMRDKISREDATLTTTYYYPGPHTARLIANDSVIRETKVNITTRDWVGLAIGNPMLAVPTIMQSEAMKVNGSLHITRDQLSAQRVAIDKSTAVGYYYVPENRLLDGKAFAVKARVKSDSLLNLGCPKIGILVFGADDYHSAILTQNGCSGEAMLKLGNHVQDGKHTDLSHLSLDVYQWQTFEMKVTEGRIALYLQGEERYATHEGGPIGDVLGFCFYFTGTGLIDAFELTDREGNLVYGNQF